MQPSVTEETQLEGTAVNQKLTEGTDPINTSDGLTVLMVVKGIPFRKG